MVSRPRAVFGLACACSLLVACSGGGGPETVVVTSTSFVAEPPAPQPTPAPDAQSLLDATVTHVLATFGGEFGAATVGENGPVVAGFSDASPAWSTIKVPITVAAMQNVPSLQRDVRAALTVSDNAAAERLFNAVGPDAVDLVLGEAGLAARVNTVKVRPEFSTFGQTMLSVGDEAVLANYLACLAGAGPVLTLMGQVDAAQRYGLGTADALFKGGWGPDTAGNYHVRQFGLIPRGDGVWSPVALTALPGDGTYETGQAMLTAAAQQLAGAAALPAARCQP